MWRVERARCCSQESDLANEKFRLHHAEDRPDRSAGEDVTYHHMLRLSLLPLDHVASLTSSYKQTGMCLSVYDLICFTNIVKH